MHFHGYVFANDPKPLMDSLIHFNGEPPAEVWLPLVVGDDTGRSGWTKVEPEDWEREIPYPYRVEDWVHCVWSTTFLRERLGPYALLSDEALDSAGVSHRNVRLFDGRMVRGGAAVLGHDRRPLVVPRSTELLSTGDVRRA